MRPSIAPSQWALVSIVVFPLEDHVIRLRSIAQLKRVSFDRYFVPCCPRELTPS